VGLFAGLSKTHSPLLGYKESTDALRDNLYLLLNMDKIPKLLMVRTISPWPVPKMPTDGLEDRGYVVRDRDAGEKGHKGRRLVRKAPNPIQGRMLYGFTKVKKGRAESHLSIGLEAGGNHGDPKPEGHVFL